MDRGVVVCVAHVRGGGEMGRAWYEAQGKYLRKKNTFRDFVDVASALVANGTTSPEKLAISGRSAGGLLVGASINLAPRLFKCAVAAVPFVDVMVSMCDASIPLTTGEWEEWGNPNEAAYFPKMLSYSPMENVLGTDGNSRSRAKRGRGAKIEKTEKTRKPKTFPAPRLLVTSGLHDPAWRTGRAPRHAARMREATTPEARVLPPGTAPSRRALLRVRPVQVLQGESLGARLRAGQSRAERGKLKWQGSDETCGCLSTR